MNIRKFRIFLEKLEDYHESKNKMIYFTNSNLDENLSRAVKSGDSGAVDFLLQKGANPDFQESEFGCTLLIVAAFQNDLECTKVLLQAKADPNIKSDKGLAPISFACNKGFEDMVAAYISNDADVNISNGNGYTPLHDAIEGGHINIVRMLLAAGADVNAQENTKKNTPLHFAIHFGHKDILKLLLEYNPQIFRKNIDSVTPLFIAAANEHPHMMRLLVNHSPTIKHPLPEINDAALLECKKAASLRQQCRDEDNISKAEAIFQEVINRYPDFWQGYLGLGDIFSIRVNQDPDNSSLINEQKTLLKRAADLAPMIEEPLLRLAHAISVFEPALAESYYNKAIEANNDPDYQLYPENYKAGVYWSIAMNVCNRNGFESLAKDAFCRAIQIEPHYYGGEVMPSGHYTQNIWRCALMILPDHESSTTNVQHETNSPDDLQEKIQKVRQEIDEFYKPYNDSVRLFARFKEHGTLADLNEAISLAKIAINRLEDDPPSMEHASKIYFNYGNLLYHRNEINNVVQDLYDSLSYCEKALTHSNEKEGTWFKCHTAISNACLALFQDITGDLEDLEKSIKHAEIALASIPEHEPAYQLAQSSLGSRKVSRFAITGRINDLNEAVEILERSNNNLFEDYPNKDMVCNNIGIAWRNLVYIVENSKERHRYISKAIESLGEAASINQSDIPAKTIHHTNLGNAFLTRYQMYDEKQDLTNAIESYQFAVTNTPPESLRYFTRSVRLAQAFIYRYELNQEVQDLHMALDILNAMHSGQLSQNSPQYATMLGVHAEALRLKYSKSKNPKDKQEAIKFYRRALELGSEIDVKGSITIAKIWLNWAFLREAWPEVKEAYQFVDDCGEKLLQAQMLRHNKEFWLQETQGLAARASYACAKLNHFHEAVLAVEKGQAKLLNESFSFYATDLKRLLECGYEDLYNRYLESTSKWQRIIEQVDQNDGYFEKLQSLQERIDDIIISIRAIDGFGEFLKPVGYETIYTAASHHPLIYLLATDKGGLALVAEQNNTSGRLFTKDTDIKVTSVWLDKLTTQILNKYLYGEEGHTGYFGSYNRWRSAPNNREFRQDWCTSLMKVTHWLWEAGVSSMIQPFSKGQSLILIPIGLLGMLPWHAAWRKNDKMKHEREYIFDPFFISYAPNAQALRAAKIVEVQVQYRTFLGIDQPEPTTSRDLILSNLETNLVASHFSSSKVLSKKDATLQQVKNLLSTSQYIHFSCHGGANFSRPLESCLSLANDTPFTLEQIIALKLPPTRIISLSACEVGVQGDALPDEVVSFPAGLLSAGVAGVVSSLWLAQEQCAFFITTYLYEYWQKDNGASPAEALACAQQWLRDSSKEQKLEYVRRSIRKLADNENIELDEHNHDIISSLEKSNLDFSHPMFWSNFIYTGV